MLVREKAKDNAPVITHKTRPCEAARFLASVRFLESVRFLASARFFLDRKAVCSQHDFDTAQNGCRREPLLQIDI